MDENSRDDSHPASPDADPGQATRRDLLGAAAGAAVLGLGTRAAVAESYIPRIRNGRIKQSLVQWCYAAHFDVPRLIQVAKQLGCGSIEILEPKYYPMLKENGLESAIAGIDMGPDAPFVKGFNNPRHHERVIKATRDAIDACVPYGYKNVICFTGMADGLSPEEGARNCVAGLKQVIGHAEKNNVTLCLEMLNTRDASHPMKGHPGYQGNHTDYCVDIIRRVDSPNMKLLFDIYHVSIMDGDIIRRIRKLKDVIGHVHTAGNPGRGELDDKQEIAYKPIIEALLEIGYKGYVGQEFIPTRDPLAGLEQAVAVCDV